MPIIASTRKARHYGEICVKDEVMEKIQAAILTSQTGERTKAIADFENILPVLGNDPLHNCIFAHYFADLQDDEEEELRWDLHSLEYLDRLSAGKLREFSEDLDVRAFYASIYLNIAEDYRKLNQFESSSRYARLAEKSAGDLPGDGYGLMIRNGILRLAGKLADETTASTRLGGPRRSQVDTSLSGKSRSL